MAEHKVSGKPKSMKKHPVMRHTIEPADGGSGYTSRTQFNAKSSKSKHIGMDTAYPPSQEVVHENLDDALNHAKTMLGGSDIATGQNPAGQGEPTVTPQK